MHFSDGSEVPNKREAKYLGCTLHIKADAKREINKRVKDCMVTLHKMHIFFYNSDNTIARKLQMFNAILRAKIMYGLETAVLTAAELNKLDVFQLRCLRKILKLPTTYINRTYTNDYIRTQLNKYLHDYARSRSTSFKAVEPLSVYHKRAHKLPYKIDSEPRYGARRFGHLRPLNPTRSTTRKEESRKAEAKLVPGNSTGVMDNSTKAHSIYTFLSCVQPT